MRKNFRFTDFSDVNTLIMGLGALADLFEQISLSVLKILLYSNDIFIACSERLNHSFHSNSLCQKDHFYNAENTKFKCPCLSVTLIGIAYA